MRITRGGIKDTDPVIEEIGVQISREMSTEKILELIGDAFETGKELAMAGLRARFPEASESEIRRRLADELLGEELANEVYGPLVTAGK